MPKLLNIHYTATKINLFSLHFESLSSTMDISPEKAESFSLLDKLSNMVKFSIISVSIIISKDFLLKH